MLRHMTEEVNLTANSAAHDAMNAEFLRTFNSDLSRQKVFG